MTTTNSKFVPKPTRCVAIEARDEKTEGMRTRLNSVQRVNKDEKGSVGNTCPYCKRVFPKLVGLSLPLTRWCKLNPSGAGGAIPPLAAHISSHDQAQNHISGWSYALTNLDSKQPSAVLTSFQMRSQ